MKHRDDGCDFIPGPGEDGYDRDVLGAERRKHAKRKKAVRARKAVNDGVSTLF